MHLFPRSVKEKLLNNTNNSALTATNRSATQKTNNTSTALTTTSTTAEGGVAAIRQQLSPDPARRVYLTTIDKANPLRRNIREIGRGHAQQEVLVEPKKRDEEKELVHSCAPYTESFNHLLRGLSKRNKTAVTLVVERMRQESIPLDATTYNLLLERVVDIKDDVAFQIYEDFKDEALKDDASVRPDLQTFHLMIRACERNGHYERAFHLYSQMKELFGLYPDVAMYNTLIGFCAPLKDEAQASSIVEEMKDRSVEPDVHTYNCLMNVFSDAPYEVTLQTFQDMLKRDIKPNRRSYNTLMKACQKTWDYDRAFQFFEELKKEGLLPDVVTYNILLVMCRERLDFVFGTGAHSQIRRTKEQKEVGMKAVAELAMSLFGEMEELGVVPNSYTYNALLAVLGRCHDYRAYDIFEQMKSDTRVGQGDETTVEDIATSWVVENSAAQGLPKLLPPCTPPIDDVDDNARIAAQGVHLNLETYKIMIDASSRLRLPEKAFALFDELKERRIRPTKDVFLMMIDVCVVKSEKQKAYMAFEEAKSYGLRIDTDLYNALMNVLASASDPQLFQLFDSLRSDKEGLSLKPSQDSYNIVLQGCFNMKQAPQAMKLYREMCLPDSPIQPDTVSYGILIDTCSINKDVALASNFILDMKRRGVSPTVNTYCRLMNVFVQAEDSGVMDVFNEMKKHGPLPNLDAYLILLQYHLNSKNPVIVPLFDELKASGVEPDLSVYNLMLEYCATIGNHQKAFKFFEELKTRGLNPDIETYNALIKVFAPTGSEFVYKVFEEMSECKIAPDHVTFAILMKHKAGRHCLATASDQHLIYVEPPLPAIK